MTRPRVWLVPYLRGWSYDITARALEQHLSDRFEIRIAYQDDGDYREMMRWEADVYVDFWWNGSLHRRFGERVVKQVSSHRWSQERYGSLTPARMLALHAGGRLGSIVVPSVRLLELLADPRVSKVRKGFDPSLLEDRGRRRGAMAVGWAGVSEAKDKRLELISAADPTVRLADQCLTQGEMCAFYNDVDVIAIASTAEGDPRPLIEGMACGCFPVSTDVGIVPELVDHEENGLIVEPTVEAFAAAFAWCRANIEHVRSAGRRNAERMLKTRTWSRVAPSWGDVFDRVIEQSRAAAGYALSVEPFGPRRHG